MRRRSRRRPITYLEGYLWDPKDAKDAFVKAATAAHGAGRSVALTLSDAFCVGRYRGEFLDLMRKRIVDLVFANEAELTSLYETADFDTALAQFRKDVATGVVTRSEKGCVVVSKDGDGHGARIPGGKGRRYHWRGRSVRVRLPVRAGSRICDEEVRPSSVRWRRRR